MNSDDNCATALEDIQKNAQVLVNDDKITINQVIPLGHKFALNDINEGNLVKKYGQPIGITTKKIIKGDWIHTHNLTSQYLKEVLKK
jgi:altronate dehydratase